MIGKGVDRTGSSPAEWRSDMIGKTISHNKILEKLCECGCDAFSYLRRFQMQLRTSGGKTTPDAAPVLSLCALILLCTVGTARAQHGVDPAWGPEMQITADGLNASGAVGRQLAIDQAGYYHVVYQNLDTWNVFYTRSMDAGSTWISPVQLSTGTFAASGPVIALGQSGTLHVCWLNRVEGGENRIHYTRFIPGTGWEAPRDISGALALDCAIATLVADTSDRVHLAWHIGDASLEEYDPSEAARVYYTRSTNGGDTFETPQQISDSPDRHAAWPRLSLRGTDGDLLAFAWRDNRNHPDWDIYAAVSTDGGDTFEEYPVSEAPNKEEWDPEAAVDPYGVIHVTYFDDPGPIVHYRRSTDGGSTWSSEVDLSDYRGTFPSFAYHPATSRLWVLWKDERDRVNPGDRRSDIITCYSDDGGSHWSDHEFVTDLGDIDVRYPSIAIDPQGIPVVEWTDLRNGTAQSTMFLKRRDYPVPAVSLAGIVIVTMLTLAAAGLALQRRRDRKIGRT